jgi:hypothetical protein
MVVYLETFTIDMLSLSLTGSMYGGIEAVQEIGMGLAFGQV